MCIFFCMWVYIKPWILQKESKKENCLRVGVGVGGEHRKQSGIEAGFIIGTDPEWTFCVWPCHKAANSCSFFFKILWHNSGMHTCRNWSPQSSIYLVASERAFPGLSLPWIPLSGFVTLSWGGGCPLCALIPDTSGAKTKPTPWDVLVAAYLPLLGMTM